MSEEHPRLLLLLVCVFAALAQEFIDKADIARNLVKSRLGGGQDCTGRGQDEAPLLDGGYNDIAVADLEGIANFCRDDDPALVSNFDCGVGRCGSHD